MFSYITLNGNCVPSSALSQETSASQSSHSSRHLLLGVQVLQASCLGPGAFLSPTEDAGSRRGSALSMSLVLDS